MTLREATAAKLRCHLARKAWHVARMRMHAVTVIDGIYSVGIAPAPTMRGRRCSVPMSAVMARSTSFTQKNASAEQYLRGRAALRSGLRLGLVAPCAAVLHAGRM